MPPNALLNAIQS